MSELNSQMSDDIRQLQVTEVQRTTELPPLRVMFLGRDHPTAEDVVEYYRKLTGRRVTRLYHYVTPTLHHVSWHIDAENNVEPGGRDGIEAAIQDS